MIKTLLHTTKELTQRDKDVNSFYIEHKVFATQTNITLDGNILTTIFYESKSK